MYALQKSFRSRACDRVGVPSIFKVTNPGIEIQQLQWECHNLSGDVKAAIWIAANRKTWQNNGGRTIPKN